MRRILGTEYDGSVTSTAAQGPYDPGMSRIDPARPWADGPWHAVDLCLMSR
jgi:hypothetical protein